MVETNIFELDPKSLKKMRVLLLTSDYFSLFRLVQSVIDTYSQKG